MVLHVIAFRQENLQVLNRKSRDTGTDKKFFLKKPPKKTDRILKFQHDVSGERRKNGNIRLKKTVEMHSHQVIVRLADCRSVKAFRWALKSAGLGGHLFVCGQRQKKIN